MMKDKHFNAWAILLAAMLASIVGLLTLANGSARGAVTVPSGFTQSLVVSGLTNPTDIEFAPDGRLFVAEQVGKVRIAKPNGTLATFLDISAKVDSAGERGLLGIAFDPNFSTNRYVYLHYTQEATTTTPAHNRITRVTANGDKAVAGSEKLIFRLDKLGTNTHHNGGAIDFGKDGKLYISTGDNVSPDKPQLISNLFGKLLRINKDGTIPSTNPFYSTATGNNRAIWALGLRNPFKFAVRRSTGAIFINDVGKDTWEEIDRGASGANYGWSLCEGYQDNPDVAGSVNCSATPYTPPIFAYQHDGDPATTGCSITGGAFYEPATVRFPNGYVGDYFFADFCNGWIRTYDPASRATSGFATGLINPVDLEVSSDGELYYLSRASTGSVNKIGYTGN